MMLKKLFVLAFFTLGFISGSPAQTAAPALKVQNGQKVAFLGDSITQSGWQRPGGYVRLVVDGLESAGVKIIPLPAGISGNTSIDMLARLDRDVLSKKPDWMTLSCGVNDVWHGATGVELEPYKANITAIVDQAQAAGIKVMILTATVINEKDNPNNQKLEAYNQFLKTFAGERKLPLVDLNAACWKAIKAAAPVNGELVLTVDGVHMNPEGNMMMARGILEGFGMAPEQIAKFEASWRTAPEAACAIGSLSFQGTAGIPLQSLSRLQAMAKEQKIPLAQLQNDLLLEALRAVLQAHAQEPRLSSAQIQQELQAAFAKKLAETTAPGAK